jgi:hypothetical protein
VPLEENRNIWGVNDFWQKVFNSGGLGAIIATVLASLIWRVLASEFPLAFLSSIFARPIIALCLGAERTGIINISWSLAALQRRVMGFHQDEHYLGSKVSNNVRNDSKESHVTLQCGSEEDCSNCEITGDSTAHQAVGLGIDEEGGSNSETTEGFTAHQGVEIGIAEEGGSNSETAEDYTAHQAVGLGIDEENALQ